MNNAQLMLGIVLYFKKYCALLKASNVISYCSPNKFLECFLDKAQA